MLKSKRKGHIFSFQLASIYPMTSNVVLNFRVYFLYKACRYKSLLDILLEDKSHKLQRCKIFTEAKWLHSILIASYWYNDDTCNCEQNVCDHLYICNKNATDFSHSCFLHHEHFHYSRDTLNFLRSFFDEQYLN